MVVPCIEQDVGADDRDAGRDNEQNYKHKEEESVHKVNLHGILTQRLGKNRPPGAPKSFPRAPQGAILQRSNT